AERLESERNANSARILLREMNHRVANDLAVVATILDAGTTESPDARSREILQQALNKVHVFTVVHRELSFREAATASVDGRVFVEKLGKALKGTIPREIEVAFEQTGDQFSLSQSQAVTLGLI